jgi:predicted thioredoxin/glutaredoxin
MEIEVIGLEPPCEWCTQLLENVREAVRLSGIDAVVAKHWTLAKETRDKYGLLLSPALVIDGMVVAQGKVFSVEKLVTLLKG